MKLTKLVVPIAVFFGLFLNKSFAQHVNADALDQLFRHVAINNQAIGTVAISRGGKEIYHQNFGQENLTSPGGSKETMVYHIGSVTKMFTAIMVFQLADKGKIELSEPLSNYFADLPNAGKITLKHLLEHSSGLGDYLTKQDSLSRWLIQPVKSDEILSEINRQGTRFQPGDSIRYSNTGYYLLSRILEKKYKMPYGKILQKQIIGPLKLADTYSMPKNVKLDVAAKPFRFEKQWQQVPDLYFANVIGVGDIACPPSELNRVLYALFDQGLVSPSSLGKMKGGTRRSFGAGLMQIPYNGKTFYGHGGDTFGSHSLVLFNPQDSIGIAISLNGQVFSANNLAIAILDRLYSEDFVLPNFNMYVVDPLVLDLYTGDYSSDSFPVKMKVFRDNNTLRAQATGQPAFSLEPLEKHKFGRRAIGLQMEFKPEENQMIFSQRGKKFVLTRPKAGAVKQ